MKNLDFSTTLLVDSTPQEVFNAVNNVRGWWSENIDGETDRLHAEFFYRYQGVHSCKMIIAELMPGTRQLFQLHQSGG